MTMNKTKYIIILLASLLITGVTSCSVNEEGIFGSFPYLEIDETETSLTKVASSTAIPYKSNRTVKAKLAEGEYNSWLRVTTTADAVILDYEENPLEEERTAHIDVYTPNSLVKKRLTITQDASGELTIKNDLILHSKAEIQSNSYTKTTGNLIIGDVQVMTKAAGSYVTVENNQYRFNASPSDIKDADLEPLKEQIHMIGKRGMAVVNTQVKNFPIEIMKNNDVNVLYFDYNAMSELPSAEILGDLRLKELSIRGNEISDISALQNCQIMTYLDISGNDIYDIDPLLSLTSLEKVIIDDLPLTQSQVEIFNEKFQSGEVVIESIRPDESPLPIFDQVQIQELSDNKVKLTATITKNNTGIQEVGFYIGNKRNLDNMDKFVCTNSNGTFTLTYTAETLHNMIYHVRAYVVTDKGTNYSDATYFGSLTSENDIMIKNLSDLEKFYDDNYSHVNGSVLIGNIASSGTGVKLNDGNYSYIFKESEDLSDLSKLSTLVYVRDGLYIGNVGLKNLNAISHIKGMQTLWLKGNKLSSIPALSCAETVTTLDVSMNDFNNFNFIEKFPKLTKLILGANDAPKKETNDIGLLTGLEEYTQLEYIDLSGLPIHQWQVDDLRALMPETEIVFASGGKTPYIPTVKTNKMKRAESTITINATVSSKGKSEITEYGFYYGKDLTDMTKVELGSSIAEGENFSYSIDVQDLDVYYYYPYAKNKYGESRIAASEFSLAYMDLSQNGTANCYLIQIPGKYKFDASVRGNSLESVGQADTVEVVWEFRNPADYQSIISSVYLNDGYVEFEIAEDAQYGNALIAVKDANGTILWSWHIWLCDFEPEETAHKYKNGNVLMDRHLGATTGSVTTSDERERASGTLYQWGRKDPMVQWTITHTRYAYNNFVESFAEPTTFVTGEWWAYDVNNTLWSPYQKTMYDPCPPGWTVASKDSWTDVESYDHNAYGMMIRFDDDGNSIRYPFSYYYDSDFNYNYAEYSYLWTSDYDTYSSGWNFVYSPWHLGYGTLWQTHACPVRCMKDAGFAVTTDSVKAYTESAVLNGTVRYMDIDYVSERGFVYSDWNSTPNVNDATVIASGSGEGSYSETLTGLKPNTTYWVRAYAVGGDVTRYGSVIEFKTAVAGSGDDFTEDDYEWE